MSEYSSLLQKLPSQPQRWLVTGAAGFIGSNLVEHLLKAGQSVVGLDNFSTGHRANLEQLRQAVAPAQWKNFKMLEGDIRELRICQQAAGTMDYVLHQAALGSVPRSINNPLESHDSNVTGFLNMLVAARDARVKRFVYASSSSVYGDEPGLPKVEDKVGHCLSPYAATKAINELYADVFARCYNFPSIGLRYFNVFGPRQDPNGPYAAVIPKWISAMVLNQPVTIYGDGETSRDFCYVANVVQANLLAATTGSSAALNQVFNVAVAGRTTLNHLFALLLEPLRRDYPHLAQFKPVYAPFRAGDIRHSHADIAKARKLLGYQPSHTIEQGLAEALGWYKTHL